MTVSQFVHPFTFEEHSGCFWVLVIVNKAATNIHMQVLYGHKFLNQLSKHLTQWLLHHKALFRFIKHCQTLFQSGCTILNFYQQWIRVPVAPHLHSRWYYIFLDFSHSSRYIVVSHCHFNLQFSYDKWYRASFHIISICISYLVRYLFWPLAHF